MLKLNLRLNGMAFVLSVLLSLLLNRFSPVSYSYWFSMVALFFLFFFVSGLISNQRLNQEDFTAYLLLNLSIKLLIAFVCIAFCAFLFRKVFLPFSAHFVSQFLIFTGFEIRFIYQLIKFKEPKND